MNYYPYYQLMTPKYSLFGSIKKGFNFQSILNGTQKFLNIANQTIPLIKQASPMINNARTMFKVISEFRKTDNTTIDTSKVSNNNVIKEVNSSDVVQEKKIIQTSGPTFFNV